MLKVIIFILAPVEWRMTWDVTNSGVFGFTLFDDDANVILSQPAQKRSFDGSVTSPVSVARIVFDTNNSDGFTGRFIIKENGETIESDYVCTDCKSGATCIDNIDIDTSLDNGNDVFADCVNSCTFEHQRKYSSLVKTVYIIPCFS